MSRACPTQQGSSRVCRMHGDVSKPSPMLLPTAFGTGNRKRCGPHLRAIGAVPAFVVGVEPPACHVAHVHRARAGHPEGLGRRVHQRPLCGPRRKDRTPVWVATAAGESPNWMLGPHQTPERHACTYPRRSRQIKIHSRAAHPCSIERRVGIQRVKWPFQLSGLGTSFYFSCTA